MDDKLRYLSADVEANVDVPDFEAIAARGHRIRRRRTVAAGVATAVVVAVVAVMIGIRVLGTTRSMQPVHRPLPNVDSKGARALLANPGAYFDTDASRVDGRGDVLSVVRVAGGSCPGSSSRTALRWLGPAGSTTTWLDSPRSLVPLADGFVVGSLPAGCEKADPTEPRAYLVDATGVPREITWAAGAEVVCAEQPADPRCRYDVATRRGWVVAGAHLPAGAVLLQSPAEGMLWARSGDSRRIFWSADGRSWRSRTSSLAPFDMVDTTAAGRRAALAGKKTLEYTSDGGRTWHSKDLSKALRSVRIADVDWTVTRSGDLLGVTELVGRGDVLFRSTDDRWGHFKVTHVHTGFGLVRPFVEGGTIYVPDTNGFLISTDDGATWRHTPALS